MVTATLTVGGETVSQTLDTPARQGIYKFSLSPKKAGQGLISFDIKSNDEVSRLVSPTVNVYTNSHDAQHAAANAKAKSSNGVVFTKEMSWMVNFCTDSCRRESFGQVIRTMAKVQPAQGDECVVVAKASGIVTFTDRGLTEGQAVSKGQTLMTIESSGMADDNLEVRYREAEAAYRLAKAEYERKQSLAADKIVSESEMQKARGDYEQAEAKYRNLRSNFASGKQTATAIISGFVKQLHVVGGQYVEAGQPLITITQSRNLQIRAEVQPRYYEALGNIATATVKYGQRALSSELPRPVHIILWHLSSVHCCLS